MDWNVDDIVIGTIMPYSFTEDGYIGSRDPCIIPPSYSYMDQLLGVDLDAEPEPEPQYHTLTTPFTSPIKSTTPLFQSKFFLFI